MLNLLSLNFEISNLQGHSINLWEREQHKWKEKNRITNHQFHVCCAICSVKREKWKSTKFYNFKFKNQLYDHLVDFFMENSQGFGIFWLVIKKKMSYEFLQKIEASYWVSHLAQDLTHKFFISFATVWNPTLGMRHSFAHPTSKWANVWVME